MTLLLVRKTLLVVAVATVLVAVPADASASHDPTGQPLDEDFVTGSVVAPEQCAPITCFHIVTVFDAHSGPSGENPRGTVRIDLVSPLGTSTFASGPVTCLNVIGNRASAGANFDSGFAATHFLEDNDGAGHDRALFVPVFGALPGCPANPSGELTPIFGGNITVHDAPRRPTSKDQCTQGGWRDFPGFKNQGDCVSHVATGGKNPPSG